MNGLPNCRADIEALIPHRGSMCMLERVLSFSPDALHAQTCSHQMPDHPLRQDDALSALHLCEYGAQAMAVHGGLLAARQGAQAAAGWLVSLRGVQLFCERIDRLDGPLDVFVDQVVDSGSGWQSQFRIEHRGDLLASGRCAVIKQPNRQEDLA